MGITASEIHNQSFSIDRKGYDVDEVDVFLEHVADEIDGLNDLIEELQQQAEEARFAGFDTVSMDAVAAAEEPAAALVAPVAPAAPAPVMSESEKDARIAELERQLEENRADGNAIAQALIIAQRSADDLLAKANNEADAIVAKAHEEAAAIIAQAEAEKKEVEDEIVKLDDDCEAMREAFQGILKGFINDSTAKLAEIGEVSIKNSAHARTRRASWSAPVQNTPNEPVAVIEPGVNSASLAGMGQTVEAPAVAAPMGKDLSGFGDAAVDDFDFDDLD